MRPSDGRSQLLAWAVAIGVVAVSGLLAWLLDGATSGPGVCEQHDHAVLAAGSVILIVIAPTAVAVAGRRAGRRLRDGWLPLLASALLGPVVVLVCDLLWAATHSCFS